MEGIAGFVIAGAVIYLVCRAIKTYRHKTIVRAGDTMPEKARRALAAKRIEALQARATKEDRQRVKAEAETQRLLKLALTCPRCDKLALPIPDTKNRYHCPDCEYQFAGDPHNL